MEPTFTAQDYLDLLVQRTLDGTMPSFDPVTRRCRYRTADGKHACGFGVLIPDATYCEEMEDKWVTALDREFHGICELYPEGWTTENISNVQCAHDRAVRTMLNRGVPFQKTFFEILWACEEFKGCDFGAAAPAKQGGDHGVPDQP